MHPTQNQLRSQPLLLTIFAGAFATLWSVSTPSDTATEIADDEHNASEPRWLDDVEMAAWRGYIESLSALTVALETDLAPHALTMGDYEVLVLSLIHISDPRDRTRSRMPSSA